MTQKKIKPYEFNVECDLLMTCMHISQRNFMLTTTAIFRAFRFLGQGCLLCMLFQVSLLGHDKENLSAMVFALCLYFQEIRPSQGFLDVVSHIHMHV